MTAIAPSDAARIIEIWPQPNRKPGSRPQAVRQNTYMPPVCGSALATSAMVSAPQRANSPPATHTAIIGSGPGSLAAMPAGDLKMPDPMVDPMTTATALQTPSLRCSSFLRGTSAMDIRQLYRAGSGCARGGEAVTTAVRGFGLSDQSVELTALGYWFGDHGDGTLPCHPPTHDLSRRNAHANRRVPLLDRRRGHRASRNCSSCAPPAAACGSGRRDPAPRSNGPSPSCRPSASSRCSSGRGTPCTPAPSTFNRRRPQPV